MGPGATGETSLIWAAKGRIRYPRDLRETCSRG